MLKAKGKELKAIENKLARRQPHNARYLQKLHLNILKSKTGFLIFNNYQSQNQTLALSLGFNHTHFQS